MTQTPHTLEICLVSRVGPYLCAAPIGQVIETMRPLPIVPVGGAPQAVLGMALIRGASVPVVSLSALLGIVGAAAPGRFVTVPMGDRGVALAVDEVVGVRGLDVRELAAVPPLLRAAQADTVASIGTHDGALLVVLHTFRILSGWTPPDAAEAVAP